MVHLVCNLSSSWAMNFVHESQGMEIKRAISLFLPDELPCIKFAVILLVGGLFVH